MTISGPCARPAEALSAGCERPRQFPIPGDSILWKASRQPGAAGDSRQDYAGVGVEGHAHRGTV